MTRGRGNGNGDVCLALASGPGCHVYPEVNAHYLKTLIPGRAVQVDPIKPTLKPPGTKHLKLKCDILLPNFAFKINLRRYTPAGGNGSTSSLAGGTGAAHAAPH
jgi:hypothetical protein